MLNMSSENIEKLRNQSNQVSLDEINHGIVTPFKNHQRRQVFDSAENFC